MIAVWTLAIAALLAAVIPALANEWRFDDVERVVAIADIHGAYAPMLKALQNADVVNEDLSWSGGATHLVIVGDILDRGPDSRQVMDFLMQLESEALAAGGRVHTLIGNHEVMNLTGDLRYVSLAEYEAFADDEIEEERRDFIRKYAVRRSYAINGERGTRRQFEKLFPEGFFAHRSAFASDGKYGAWLLTKPLVVVINDTAFVHGGLSPMIADIGLNGVNGGLQDDLVDYVRQMEILIDAGVLLPTDSFYDHPDLVSKFKVRDHTPAAIAQAKLELLRLFDSGIHAPDGPLWYRGNVGCSERVEADKLDSVLQAIGASRVVIGHTPTPGRLVLQRMGGRIIEIDTGMFNDYYGGSANVLTIDSSGTFVVNQDDEKAVEPAMHPRHVGARPHRHIAVDTLEDMLRNGEIVSRKRKDALGRQRIRIAYDETILDATFIRRPADGVFPDVAAYRLDRLLQLDMVPVAVVREVNGVTGSVQFNPRDSMDERERRRRGRGAEAWCPLSEQWQAMSVFDALIDNPMRDARSMHYDPYTWQLILLAHDKSFTERSNVSSKFETASLQVGPSWKEELAALDGDVLQQHLGDVLDESRLQSLVNRRDRLIAVD